jgi:hypothetical protein
MAISTSCRGWSMLFADPVHEEFNAPASWTGVDIETVAFHKQLSQLP